LRQESDEINIAKHNNIGGFGCAAAKGVAERSVKRRKKRPIVKVRHKVPVVQWWRTSKWAKQPLCPAVY
jgi:hypothetical protein